MDTNTASILVRTLAQFPQNRGLGDESPQQSQGAEPQWDLGVKPTETGNFVTMSFNFYADIYITVLSVYLCDSTMIELNKLFV